LAHQIQLDPEATQVPVRRVIPILSYASQQDRKKQINGTLVRVIGYKFKWVRNSERYRLITTILEPEKAPAEEFAVLYHDRWEIETALGECKTKLKGAGIILRSRTPELVKQEFYGFMLTYYTLRALMHEAALQANEDPDKLSFKHTVQVIRRKIHLFRIPPPRRRWTEIRQAIIDEILEERVEPRRHRQNHRGVKRKMSVRHASKLGQGGWRNVEHT
jgi:hypothetical protein